MCLLNQPFPTVGGPASTTHAYREALNRQERNAECATRSLSSTSSNADDLSSRLDGRTIGCVAWTSNDRSTLESKFSLISVPREGGGTHLFFASACPVSPQPFPSGSLEVPHVTSPAPFALSEIKSARKEHLQTQVVNVTHHAHGYGETQGRGPETDRRVTKLPW